MIIIVHFTPILSVGLGIDKNFTIPIPLTILWNDSIPYRFSYRFQFGGKKENKRFDDHQLCLLNYHTTLQTQQGQYVHIKCATGVTCIFVLMKNEYKNKIKYTR